MDKYVKQTRTIQKTTARTSCSQLRLPEGEAMLQCWASWPAESLRSQSGPSRMVKTVIKEQTDGPQMKNEARRLPECALTAHKGIMECWHRLTGTVKDSHLQAVSRSLSLFVAPSAEILTVTSFQGTWMSSCLFFVPTVMRASALLLLKSRPSPAFTSTPGLSVPRRLPNPPQNTHASLTVWRTPYSRRLLRFYSPP